MTGFDGFGRHALVLREYGTGNDTVIVLHGGPGAAGDAAPLARELGKRWHVFEPYQRGSGERRLSVATHVEDLDHVVTGRCRQDRPVLVGHSWGAMLALAYAADHPASAAAIVLVGCGTFSVAARNVFRSRLDGRVTQADRATIAEIERNETNADRRLASLGRLMTRLYGYDVEDVPDDEPLVDASANEQTWADMLRLQRGGVYPAAFAAIRVPILMLHGDADPHPAHLIRDDLRLYIPQIEYYELTKCGHYPWLERHAKHAFFDVLNTWLATRFQENHAVVEHGAKLD